MDYDLEGMVTGIAIHPKKHKLLAVGIDDTVHFIEHISPKLKSTRNIKLGDFGIDFIFNQDGSQLNTISRNNEMRLFDAELNLKRRYKFIDDTGSALARPIPKGPECHLGVDVIVGHESGKIDCYDSRESSKVPAIKLENHSNIVKSIHCLDWWNCVSVAEDGFIVLNDFRNKKKKREFGTLDGLIHDLSTCPISKKSIVCTTSNVYVFDLYDYDNGPLLKANPPLKGKTPISVLNLSTNDYPDLFAVSYLDTTYMTLLDTDNNKWLRRYPVGLPDSENFTRLEHKSDGYVYFIADSEYFCVRQLDDIRTTFDLEYNFKAKDKREESKKPVSIIDFSGLIDNDGIDVDDEDNAEAEDDEIIEEIVEYAEDEDDLDTENMDFDSSEADDDVELYSEHSDID